MTPSMSFELWALDRPAFGGTATFWLAAFCLSTFSISGISFGSKLWNPASGYCAYCARQKRQPTSSLLGEQLLTCTAVMSECSSTVCSGTMCHEKEPVLKSLFSEPTYSVKSDDSTASFTESIVISPT